MSNIDIIAIKRARKIINKKKKRRQSRSVGLGRPAMKLLGGGGGGGASNGIRCRRFHNEKVDLCIIEFLCLYKCFCWVRMIMKHTAFI